MSISNKTAYVLMLKKYPDILNIDEMCEVLQTSTKTGYKLLREGKIIGIKVGRTYRIPKVHLLSYMRIIESQQVV